MLKAIKGKHLKLANHCTWQFLSQFFPSALLLLLQKLLTQERDRGNRRCTSLEVSFLTDFILARFLLQAILQRRLGQSKFELGQSAAATLLPVNLSSQVTQLAFLGQNRAWLLLHSFAFWGIWRENHCQMRFWGGVNCE